MRQYPRPVVIANPDLVSPRVGGFKREPGAFAVENYSLLQPYLQFIGKPFPEIFETLQNRIPNTPKERIVLCGDSLHTDILGANAFGWKSILVTDHGFFANHDWQELTQNINIPMH